jgi:nitronate monooxygenase
LLDAERKGAETDGKRKGAPKSMKLQTPICEQLNIRYPVIQAGMAGAADADLAAAVSSAGALGTVGAAYMTPDVIRKTVRKIRERTDNPFAVNLFCAKEEPGGETIDAEKVQHVLNRFRKDLGIHEKFGYEKPKELFEEQFQVLMEEKVPVISTAFGLLPPDKMEQAKKAGSKVISMVTTVNEAIAAEKAGVDIIVAQGSDAGGHRGTFDIGAHPNGANIGTFSLVPQVADHVTVPVVAAGGIMDGRGLIAALALGAAGVQLGTAFLISKESAAHPVYKKALSESTEESTVITNSFSGRPARGIKNKFIEEFEAAAEPLPFPIQNALTNDIRSAAAEKNRPEYMSLWAGQATRLLSPEENAADILKNIMEEAKRILG